MIDLYKQSLFARQTPFDPLNPGSGTLSTHVKSEIEGGSSTILDLSKAATALALAGKSDTYLDTVLPQMAAIVMAVQHYNTAGLSPRFARLPLVSALRTESGWSVYSPNYDTLLTGDINLSFGSQQFTVDVGYAAYYNDIGGPMPVNASDAYFTGLLVPPPPVPLFWGRFKGTQEQP